MAPWSRPVTRGKERQAVEAIKRVPPRPSHSCRRYLLHAPPLLGHSASIAGPAASASVGWGVGRSTANGRVTSCSPPLPRHAAPLNTSSAAPREPRQRPHTPRGGRTQLGSGRCRQTSHDAGLTASQHAWHAAPGGSWATVRWPQRTGKGTAGGSGRRASQEINQPAGVGRQWRTGARRECERRRGGRPGAATVSDSSGGGGREMAGPVGVARVEGRRRPRVVGTTRTHWAGGGSRAAAAAAAAGWRRGRPARGGLLVPPWSPW